MHGKFGFAGNPDQTCTMEIWSRPWLNSNEVTLTCEDKIAHNFPVTTAEKRTKRETVGAPNYISHVDNDFDAVIQKALTNIAGSENGDTFE